MKSLALQEKKLGLLHFLRHFPLFHCMQKVNCVGAGTFGKIQKNLKNIGTFPQDSCMFVSHMTINSFKKHYLFLKNFHLKE